MHDLENVRFTINELRNSSFLNNDKLNNLRFDRYNETNNWSWDNSKFFENDNMTSSWQNNDENLISSMWGRLKNSFKIDNSLTNENSLILKSSIDRNRDV